MASLILQIAFLVVVVIICAVWGRVLWFFADYLTSFNSLVLFVMNYTRREHREIKALLLSIIYYLFGLMAALALWLGVGLGGRIGLELSLADIPLVALGIVGQISLSTLLVSIYCKSVAGYSFRQWDDLKEIPWIRGIMDLSPQLAPAAAAFGGVVEELFFRGVVLQIMVQELRMPASLAITAAGALFLLQQLLQVQTWFQAVLIGSGCIAISLIGGLLVLYSAHIVPALLCHASFVVFYLRLDNHAR